MNRQKREEMRRNTVQNNQASQSQTQQRTGPQPHEQVRGAASDDRSQHASDVQRHEGKLPLPD